MIDVSAATVKTDFDRMLLQINEQTGIFDALNNLYLISVKQNEELHKLSENVNRLRGIKEPQNLPENADRMQGIK